MGVTRRTALAVSVAIAAGGAPWLASMPLASSNAPLVSVGDIPGWAATGPGSNADTAEPVHIAVWLTMPRQEELQHVATAVSTPGDALYGHHLTAGQFHARYSPSSEATLAVSDYLRQQGFVIEEIPANHLYVAAVGTVATAQAAFHTTLRQVHTAAGERRAPGTPPLVPGGLAPLVQAVSGLTTGHVAHTQHLNADQPPQSSRSRSVNQPQYPDVVNTGQPCSAYWNEQQASNTPPAYGSVQPYALCGYSPRQVRAAYGLDTASRQGLDGRGTTVAVIGAYLSPSLGSDVDTYAKRHNEPRLRSLDLVLPQQFNPAGQDGCEAPDQWGQEVTLDIEAVHATAPGAGVVYVASPDCKNANLAAALNKVVDGQLAQVVTNSFGATGDADQLPPDEIHAQEHVFQQAAIEGIGVFFASGDNGDESSKVGHPTVNFPAADPWVTGVGGTSLGIDEDGSQVFETGWSTASSALRNGQWSPTPPGAVYAAGGGGVSTFFAQPAYQRGVVPDSIAHLPSGFVGRAVPDIAALADANTGFAVGETVTFPDGHSAFQEERIGGTSLSAPLMAGIEAVADQLAHHAHGFLNPAIYRLAKTRAVHDIVPSAEKLAVVRVNYTNNIDASGGEELRLRTFDQPTTLHTGPGWDTITGVGTPAGLVFLAGLSASSRRT